MEKMFSFSYKNINTLAVSLTDEIMREIIKTKHYLIEVNNEIECSINSAIRDEILDLIYNALSQRVISVSVDLNPFKNTNKTYLLYLIIQIAYDYCHIKVVVTPIITSKRYKKLITRKEISKDKDYIVSGLRPYKYQNYKSAKFFSFLRGNFSQYKLPARESAEGWVYSETEEYFIHKKFLIVYGMYTVLICDSNYYSHIILNSPLFKTDSNNKILEEINFYLKTNFGITMEDENLLEYLYKLELLSQF